MGEPVRALLVDDEQGIRLVLEQALRREGHEVATAANDEQALEHLRNSRFDLAIVDLKLGGGVDGMRVVEAIRWRWPGTAVVILTAHAALDTALAAIREGVDGYLRKPVDLGEMRRSARKAMLYGLRCCAAVGIPSRLSGILFARPGRKMSLDQFEEDDKAAVGSVTD
jgi:DNA-binding NtrC family response regulator